MLNYSDEMTRHDLNSTFAGTYVLHTQNGEAEPVYVCEFPYVDVAMVDTLSGRTKEVNVSELDFTMPDLGNVAVGGNTYYVSRKARRQWRRGLRLDNTLSVLKLLPSGGIEDSHPIRGMVRGLLLPPMQHDSVIDRDFARVGKWLFFRGLPVGTVDKNKVVDCPLDAKPILPEEYSYA